MIHAVDLATLRVAEGLRRSAARPKERIALLLVASAEPRPLLLELAEVDGERRRAFGVRRPVNPSIDPAAEIAWMVTRRMSTTPFS